MEMVNEAVEMATTGFLQLQVVVADAGDPVPNAQVLLTNRGEATPIIELSTDSSGRTPVIELNTPPLPYSLAPDNPRPYAEYDCYVNVEGFQPVRWRAYRFCRSVRRFRPLRYAPASYTGGPWKISL